MVFNSGRAKWVDNMRAGTRGPRLAVDDGPSQGAWAGSAPVAEADPYEESIRKQLMAQQLRSAELQNQATDQQLTSQWEAERAQMFHPYDTMPMDRMALDEGSPLYENAGGDIQMDVEPMAGIWGSSALGDQSENQWIESWSQLAPSAAPTTPQAPQRVPVPQSQWDAAFSKTNLNRWNDPQLTDDPQSKNARALLANHSRELSSINSAVIKTPEMVERAKALTEQINIIENQLLSPGAPAGAVQGPPPKATGGNWWDSVPDADKARYQQAANSGDRGTMAAIRKQYGAP